MNSDVTVAGNRCTTKLIPTQRQRQLLLAGGHSLAGSDMLPQPVCFARIRRMQSR